MPSGSTEQPPAVVVPKLITDPIWSLQPWPLTVELGGREYEIPAMPAVDWLVYLMRPQPDFDGMILHFFPDGEELLADEVLTVDEMYETVLDVITAVCGRPWWVAIRLITVARVSWHVLGPIMLEKADASRLSISGWLDILLVKTLNAMDPKETTMFSSRLESPPESERPEDPMESMEMNRGAFLSMA